MTTRALRAPNDHPPGRRLPLCLALTAALAAGLAPPALAVAASAQSPSATAPVAATGET